MNRRGQFCERIPDSLAPLHLWRASLFLVISFLSFNAEANEIALDFDTTQADYLFAAGDSTFGWEFTVSNPVTVSSLGFFDAEEPGLIEPHAVGIWDLSSSLLASTMVGNDGQPYPATGGEGQWIFQSVSPVQLGAGTYVIGAHYPTPRGDMITTDIFRGALDPIPPPSISWNNQRGGGSGFVFPSNVAVNIVGGFGPSFLLVPEPESISMFIFFAVTMLPARLRKQRA